jgi:uncharacterized membrane protein YeiH
MTSQYILEIIGTGFFCISGALAANDKSKPDWFGVTFIGFVTSIGGGSLRDILLGSYPLGWVRDVNFIYAIIAGIVIASLFFNVLINLRRTFFLFDTVGIAMFTILGTEKALAFNIHPLVAAIMGMFSAVMGGVLRDVLTNEIPVIFKKEVYATACLAGGLFYILLDNFSGNRTINILSSMLLIFVIRIVAIKYNLSLPKFRKEEE